MIKEWNQKKAQINLDKSLAKSTAKFSNGLQLPTQTQPFQSGVHKFQNLEDDLVSSRRAKQNSMNAKSYSIDPQRYTGTRVAGQTNLGEFNTPIFGQFGLMSGVQNATVQPKIVDRTAQSHRTNPNLNLPVNHQTLGSFKDHRNSYINKYINNTTF